MLNLTFLLALIESCFRLVGIELLGAVTRLGEEVDLLGLAVGGIRKQGLVELEQLEGVEAVGDEEVGDDAMARRCTKRVTI